MNHRSNINQLGQYEEIKADLHSMNISGTRRLLVRLELMELAGTN